MPLPPRPGAPVDPNWMPAFLNAAPAPLPGADRFTVVLDPGHGGIDPGAEQGSVNEKELMLSFAQHAGRRRCAVRVSRSC